jgi:hypothetical protein
LITALIFVVNFKAIKQAIVDIKKHFENFRKAEVKAWSQLGGLSPPEQLLVTPSGSFTSKISHRLNQPSFTTHVLENGETTDRTNPCIDMVLGTAFSQDGLIYDQIHRRDKDSHGSTRYPRTVRQVHQQLTRDIFESSEAKVEVVYGQKALKSIFTDSTMETTPLPL